MITETPPKEYAWQSSTRSRKEIVWNTPEYTDLIYNHKSDTRTSRYRSLRRTSSCQYIRYDLGFSYERAKKAFLDRFEISSYPDFIINIEVAPIAVFYVAKKAACRVAACSTSLPEDYRCWFWMQCGALSRRILERIKISSTISGDFGPSLFSLLLFALQAEMDMCEFLMRYCGEVMAQEFMQTATRPWTVLAQLEVPPAISFLLTTAAEDVLRTTMDYVCRRLYHEDLHQIEPDLEAISILEPQTYPNDPNQYLVRAIIPSVSYEKGKEADVSEDPTPVQPYHHPDNQGPWLSLGETDTTRLPKLELVGEKLPEPRCPSNRRSLSKQKVFYQSMFPAACRGEIRFMNKSNFFGSFRHAISALKLPSEAQVCQSQEWEPFFYAAVRPDRIGLQPRVQRSCPAVTKLHCHAKYLERWFRHFVVLWGSTVYIKSIAESRHWGGTKNQLVDLARTTNNKRVQRYSELTLGAEMDICEFILTTCSILEAAMFLQHQEVRPWFSIGNLIAQPDVSGAVERGAELALADRQHYFCYRLYTDCKYQYRSWRDSRWVVPGYFPHPGWTFYRGHTVMLRLAKPNVALGDRIPCTQNHQN